MVPPELRTKRAQDVPKETKTGARVLVVDDDPLHRRLSVDVLQASGFELFEAASAEEAFQLLGSQPVDVIVSDYKLPGMSGLELLQKVGTPPEAPPVVLVTGLGDERIAAEAIRLGAQEYVVKDLPSLGYLNVLPTLVQEALRRTAILRENLLLRQQVAEARGPSPLVGRSPAIRRILELIDEIAAVDSTVLIYGESGTGKELVAREIHRRSPRAGGPFVVANCAALPETLLEAELFGYEAGAFTGARSRRSGRFERAQGGTIFLDEVGDMPLKAQVDLLRVLQHREFERLGGSELLRVDVRVIAATHKDLPQMVREGKFREDLYYRLNVIPIFIPPLRERPEDILILAHHFLARFRARFSRPVEGFTPAAAKALVSYRWPGNVRELENLIERLVVLARGRWIDVEDLPPQLFAPPESQEPPAIDNLAVLEEMTIRRVVEATGWNLKEAARRLGIGRSTLYTKLRRYGIQRDRSSTVKPHRSRR
jgi:two-component system response regulator HydG